MSSRLVILREQFPALLPEAVGMGARMSFVITGVVRRDEAEVVDVQSLGGSPRFMLGGTEVEVLVEEINRYYPASREER